MLSRSCELKISLHPKILHYSFCDGKDFVFIFAFTFQQSCTLGCLYAVCRTCDGVIRADSSRGL